MERNEKLLNSAVAKAPKWLQEYRPYLEKAAPVVARVAAAINFVAPHVIKYTGLAIQKYNELPTEVAWGLFGFMLCFFGGVYPCTILAVETFLRCGWDQTERALLDIHGEFAKVDAKNKEDDEKDEDNDGVADVDEISGDELFTRKMDIVLVSMDPKKLSVAFAVVYTAWLSVVAVLRVEFARTVSLGASIGDVIVKTVGRIADPALHELLPEKYQKWVPMLVNYTSKAVGIMIAWLVQSAISAFHSAIRGGFMMARMGLQYAAKRKGETFDESKTSMDEMIGFAVALVGFGTQLYFGFGIPFPLNLPLLPLGITEWWIRFTLAKDDMFA